MTRRRPGRDLRSVKVMLVVGTLAASVLGTNLVAQKDAALPAQNAGAPTATVVTIDRRNSNGQQLELAPVPTAVAPALRPVARSRSSR